ncbi:hypothetical protein BDV12DRAFT_163099, partial [Aspergillus spectabilis]
MTPRTVRGRSQTDIGDVPASRTRNRSQSVASIASAGPGAYPDSRPELLDPEQLDQSQNFSTPTQNNPFGKTVIRSSITSKNIDPPVTLLPPNEYPTSIPSSKSPVNPSPSENQIQQLLETARKLGEATAVAKQQQRRGDTYKENVVEAARKIDSLEEELAHARARAEELTAQLEASEQELREHQQASGNSNPLGIAPGTPRALPPQAVSTAQLTTEQQTLEIPVYQAATAIPEPRPEPPQSPIRPQRACSYPSEFNHDEPKWPS